MGLRGRRSVAATDRAWMDAFAVIPSAVGAVHTTTPQRSRSLPPVSCAANWTKGRKRGPALPRPTSSGSRHPGRRLLASTREMDLPLYIRVLWRFRLLVLPGFLVAIALAVLAYGKVDFQHGLTITPRAIPVYHADALLLVTQKGFPWGESQQPYVPGDVSKG